MSASSYLKAKFTRIKCWEFWPFELVYIPIFIYWFWLSIRARSFFFFSASNPSIETGGLMGESKISIFRNIPEEYLPGTVLVKAGESLENIKALLQNKGISYPIIGKPDRGERGRMVAKIENDEALMNYHHKMPCDYIIQEFVSLPIELAVFYYRFPGQEAGCVSSIVEKDFLKVKGDGVSTVEQLMLRYPRAYFQYERLKPVLSSLLQKVPVKGEEILLEPIGNHARGTTFLNANHYIDEELCQAFDKVAERIEGFYYGRFDLKCNSIEELKQRKNFKILELNGAGAEPAHIYHPGMSIFAAYKTLFSHWTVLYKISVLNHKRGVPYMSLTEAREIRKKIKEYRRG